jgi:hypothetical protein
MLSEFQEELKKLCDKRDALDRRIKGLVQAIEGLRLMSQEPDFSSELTAILNSDELGLTDAVRNYFEYLAVGPVLPVEIRDALSAAGYEGGGPQSALLAIHSILSRMEKKGEIEPVKRDGKTAYRWVSKLSRAIRDEQESKKRMGKLSDMVQGHLVTEQAIPPPVDLTDPNHPLVKSGMRPQKK